MLGTFTNPFDDIMNPAAREELPCTEKVNLPMNIIKEEDDSWTVEIAVVGKTKEDISLSSKVENGSTVLYVESVEQEKTDEEKSAEEKRYYKIRKIKSGKLNVKLTVPNTLNINGLKASVANGLLTIKIPVAEEAKPTKFTIE